MENVAKGQFRNLETDPTKTIEAKVQQTLQSIKNVFPEGEYKRLFPSGSKPSAF